MGERKMSSDSRLVKEGEGEGEGEGEEGEDIWAKATKVADDLYILRDTYFPPNPLDKISKLQSQSDLSLNLLDSIPLVREKLLVIWDEEQCLAQRTSS